MAKTKGTTAAVLSLLEVQTRLEVCAAMEKAITPAEARSMVLKLESARNMLQRSILEAARILDEGIGAA
jgi:hypothetical protein